MSFGNIPIENTEDTEKCLFADCKEGADYSCHIDICERHTRKPSASLRSVKLCLDCFKIYEENKLGKK